MVSGTNMVKIIVCIFTILFYAPKKQSLWHERHFLGMNDIVITFLYNFFPTQNSIHTEIPMNPLKLH